MNNDNYETIILKKDNKEVKVSHVMASVLVAAREADYVRLPLKNGARREHASVSLLKECVA